MFFTWSIFDFCYYRGFAFIAFVVVPNASEYIGFVLLKWPMFPLTHNLFLLHSTYFWCGFLDCLISSVSVISCIWRSTFSFYVESLLFLVLWFSSSSMRILISLIDVDAGNRYKDLAFMNKSYSEVQNAYTNIVSIVKNNQLEKLRFRFVVCFFKKLVLNFIDV